MSFQKLMNGRKVLFVRRQYHVLSDSSTAILNLKTRSRWPSPFSSAFSRVTACKQMMGTKSEKDRNPSSNYSTATKPHMTAAMHKWKKRKRKSKAVQKKELENLQQDLVKLLTKRAFQLVPNKSLHCAHREVVATHSFTQFFPLRDASNEQPFDLKKHGNYFVSAVDQLEKSSPPSKLSSGTKIDIANALQDSVGHNTQSASSLSQDHFHLVNEVSDVLKYNSSSKGLTSKFDNDSHLPQLLEHSYHNHTKSAFNSLKLIDVFLPKKSAVNHPVSQATDDDFKANLSCFESELKRMSEISDSSLNGTPVHQWESDGVSGMSNETSTVYDNDKETCRSLNPSLSDYEKTTFEPGKEDKPEDVNFQDKLSLDPPLTSEHGLPFYERNRLPFLHQENHHSEELAESISEESKKKPTKKSSEVKKKAQKVKKFAKTVSVSGSTVKEIGSKRYSDKGRVNISKDLQQLIDKCFVEACCFSGFEMLAVRNLQFQIAKHGAPVIDVFNILIHSLAKKGDLKTIKTLFSVMNQELLKPNLQTYAGCLECMGRMEIPDTNLCEKLLDDISRAGFDIKSIANTCSFQSDEWSHVLKAIRLVHPDFIPDPATVESHYDHTLLTPLNSFNPEWHNQYAGCLDKVDLMARANRQLEMEKKGEVLVESIAVVPKNDALSAKIQKLQEETEANWRRVLHESFEKKLKSFEKRAHDNLNLTLYPYLKLFPPEVYIDIIFKTLKELFTASEGYSPAQSLIQANIGRAVNRKFNIETKVAMGMDGKILKLYDRYLDGYLDTERLDLNHRVIWREGMCKDYDTVNLDMSMNKWPRHVMRGVGRFLLEMILYDLKIDANLLKSKSQKRLVPAFSTIYRPDMTLHTNDEIKLHPVVSKLFKVDFTKPFVFSPSIVPMVVPPVPWISTSMGSLLMGSVSLVRMTDFLHPLDALQGTREVRYNAVLDSLNTLSACAWKINKSILDLQIKIFNNKGDPKLKIANPTSELPHLPAIKPDMTGKEKALVYRQRLQLQQQKNDMHGLWCTDLYRLSIANKFRDETFWFPHSMDFRGRTYPLPPHFNHLGSDNVRGMLLFSEGKPLGPEGMDWLKIHLVNLTGLKKRCSNKERLEFADQMKDEILDSADYPLTGRKWWQQSDEPWQTLACCMELAKIERFEGDKADYVCHFPVHQDGSCNGLQHYAALGRDEAGAKSVNLHPFESPQDVYSDVVELVERERKKDAEEGHELAIALDGFVKRKVIKQTIMTTVYGVTRFGAKAQIHRQLKDIPDFPQDLAWKASFYLTDKTFSSLCEMFTATKDIQDWLTESARFISSFAPVDWETPLGFPVLQPYFKRVSNKEGQHDKFAPNTLKQKNAFPPNYIHSLDSTHMMLTALYCLHAGITFVSVHDCYWTHASDVPIMNRICREQFVNMHRQPLLEDLSDHLVQLVQHCASDPALANEMSKVDVQGLMDLLKSLPKRGTFDLDNVLKSTYFFS